MITTLYGGLDRRREIARMATQIVGHLLEMDPDRVPYCKDFDGYAAVAVEVAQAILDRAGELP